MSPENQPVQPTPFDVAQPKPSESTATAADSPGRRSNTPSWVLPALGGLLVLALLVIFWLPERVGPDSQEPAPEAAVDTPATNEGNAPATGSKPATAEPDATPWQQAQAARLRKEAQDVLGELLDVQAALEERGVQSWAEEAFAAATAFAAAGDELYKTRQYEEAKARYQDGLDALQALQASIPQRLAEQLDEAVRAIEAGEIEAANSALDMASRIEPDSPALPALRQRVETLPELLSLLEQATVAEQTGDLAGAEQLLGQAAQLDPEHQRVRDELQRVTQAHLQQRFNDAMSDGYAALDERRFQSAREAFRRAAKLQPGSKEAASALQEVQAAETAYRLATLKQRGDKLEQGEDWQQAVKAYEDAQKIDGNVLFAAEGLARSRPRARLDKQFRQTLEEPQRLSDVAVAEATGQLLKQARKIRPAGPVLTKQISQLERLVELANTPIQLTLRSDMETEVIVYKVARLGSFQQHELSLRPGTYTAVGSRRGYRDVRLNFTINHDSAPAPLTIACTEPI